MLVFSSALRTKSSAVNGAPSQHRAYRSRMRPAFSAKAGSRGKIQVRCCHGRIASSCSHRHTVLSLTVATMPCRWASRTISAVLKRDSGTPNVAGNSHARALTWTTTSGGKSPGRPGRGAPPARVRVHGRIACALNVLVRFSRSKLGETEVEELDATLGQHDVARLQVPVNHAMPVRGIERVGDVGGHGTGAIGRKRAIRQLLWQASRHRAAP